MPRKWSVRYGLGWWTAGARPAARCWRHHTWERLCFPAEPTWSAWEDRRLAPPEFSTWDATAADDAETNGNHVWTGPFDSFAFFENYNDVRDTLPEITKVLRRYGYSDSTILTGSGGTLVVSLLFFGWSSASARAFKCLRAVRTDAVRFETGQTEFLRTVWLL